ncbi:MAG: hypothetical protein NXH97_20985 [Rhodobacteraceae bacterium]|nr:hypothetical protein [Paracoccaceae bacterium]
MAFTESDAKFASIVDGIVKARKIEPDRHFAVAIERTTGAIDNGVQEALELAQQTIDVASFSKLLETPGRSNKDMRAFVAAFRTHLVTSGETGDDALYDILRSFSVLTFDYARPNSITEQHDRFRARQLTSANDGSDLYGELFGLVLRADAIGGELNRSELVRKLSAVGISIGSKPTLAVARRHIEEMSRHALDDIGLTVNEFRLAREKPRRELEAMLQAAETQDGVVEISGPSGTGKSGLLRTVIEGRGAVSRILVLAPDRTPPGGWPALRSLFDIQATADEFLRDLACDGGGYLCIDGLDRFRDCAQRNTVIDLLRAGLRCPGLIVLFTARPGWEDEAAIWIGEETFGHLSNRRRLAVDGLDDDEAEALAKTSPQLAHLLRPDHPAKPLARNLLKLRLLLRTRLYTAEAISEAELANDWLASGAGTGKRAKGETRSRKRVIYAVGKGLIEGAGLVDVAGQNAQAVAGLITDGLLIEFQSDRVRFRHDLFTDWAVACVLSDNPYLIEDLVLDAPPPFWMARGFELACRMLAESASDDAWPLLLARLERVSASPGWAGLALLALVRSERAETLLDRYDALLLADSGLRAAQLIKWFIASHTQSAAPLLREFLKDGAEVPEGMTIPKGPEWVRLILWCLQRFDRLKPDALSAAVDLFQNWLVLGAFGEKSVTPILLNRYADILAADIEQRGRPLPRSHDSLPEVKYAVTDDALETARLQLGVWAQLSPDAAVRFLNAVRDSKRPEAAFSQILEFPGKLPSAAPAEFVDAFLRAIEEDEEDPHRYPTSSGRNRSYALSRVDSPFVLGRCGTAVFTETLQAAPATGTSFIRTLASFACALEDDDPDFSVEFMGESRRVVASFSYGWSRGRAPSVMVSKALLALEHWAHRRIDDGDTLEAVVGDVIGEGPILGALWLVIVDLVLSHSSLNGAILRDLLASPETLALDAGRANIDRVDRMGGGLLGSDWWAAPDSDRPVEEDLANRVSRSLALHDIIPQLVFSSSEQERALLRARLEVAVRRLGLWTQDAVDWASPEFMASHALRLSSRESYRRVKEEDAAGKKREGWVYDGPPGQKKWLEEGFAKASSEQSAFTRSLAVRMAMDDETKPVSVSVADAEEILMETSNAVPVKADEVVHNPNDPWLARVAAAAFLARFGSPEDLARRRCEIELTFDQALLSKDRSRAQSRDDVMYDERSLAIAGRLYLAAASGDEADAGRLSQSVVEFVTSAAPAFLRHRTAVGKIDQKLLISICRLALLACRIPRRANFGESEAAYDTRCAELESRLLSAIEAERLWREGGAEPDWPTPPRRPRRAKRTLTIRRKSGVEKSDTSEPDWPDYYLDEKTGTAWLRILERLGPNAGPISKTLMHANRAWLLATNGPGEDGADDGDIERVWTRGLMDYAAAHARHWQEDTRQALVFDVLKAFSDEAFVDAAATFIVQSDLRRIEGDAEDRAYLVSVREALWPRLKHTSHWRNHLWSKSDGMEIHLKELISAFFMRTSYGFGEGQAYTKGLSDPELMPFIPLLFEITGEAPSCPTIAYMFLHILECLEPSTAVIALAAAADRWAEAANSRFWNELGIGRRVLSIGQKAEQLSDVSAWNAACEAMMAAGVRIDTEFLERVHR